jgi:ankyrin repeat protein
MSAETPTSPVLAALYERDTERARAAAAGRALDLHEAAALGDRARVRELLAADPAGASAVTPDGFTALHLVAFFSGDADIARALVAAGAPVSAPADTDMRVTPLHSAAAADARDVAAVLLEAGADADAVQAGGYTPLHSAGATGDTALVSLLLAHGGDPDRAADDGRTAADLAAERGHAELAARLRAGRAAGAG